MKSADWGCWGGGPLWRALGVEVLITSVYHMATKALGSRKPDTIGICEECRRGAEHWQDISSRGCRLYCLPPLHHYACLFLLRLICYPTTFGGVCDSLVSVSPEYRRRWWMGCVEESIGSSRLGEWWQTATASLHIPNGTSTLKTPVPLYGMQNLTAISFFPHSYSVYLVFLSWSICHAIM